MLQFLVMSFAKTTEIKTSESSKAYPATEASIDRYSKRKLSTSNNPAVNQMKNKPSPEDRRSLRSSINRFALLAMVEENYHTQSTRKKRNPSSIYMNEKTRTPWSVYVALVGTGTHVVSLIITKR